MKRSAEEPTERGTKKKKYIDILYGLNSSHLFGNCCLMCLGHHWEILITISYNILELMRLWLLFS